MATGFSQDFPTLINDATKRASALAGTSGQLASELPNIGTLLKDRATQAYQSNQDIVKPLDEATAGYLVAPQVAREKYQDVFNPFSRERLVAQSIQNTSLPMLSLSSILGNRLGRIQDIIGAGTGAFQSQVAAEQAAAQAAQQVVDNLLKQYTLESDILYKNKSLAQSTGSGFAEDLISLLTGGKTNANDLSYLDNILEVDEPIQSTQPNQSVPPQQSQQNFLGIPIQEYGNPMAGGGYSREPADLGANLRSAMDTIGSLLGSIGGVFEGTRAKNRDFYARL